MRFFDRRLNPSDTGTGDFTGDIKSSIRTASHGKWVLMNGDTLGSPSSGATLASEIYRELYILFWDTMADAQAPVSTGRGASGTADFDANKTLTMPDARGRSLIGTGTGAGLTARTHGDTAGVEDTVVGTHGHTDTFAMANHTHPAGTLAVTLVGAGSGSENVITVSGAGNISPPTTLTANSASVSGSTGNPSTQTVTGSVDSAGVSPTDQNLGPWLAVNTFIRY